MEPTAPQLPTTTIEQPKPNQSASKKRLLMIGIILTALLLAAGGLFWWASSQQKKYATAADAYETTVANTFMAISGSPKNTDEFVQYLQKHEAALARAVAATPKQAKLFWITTAPKNAAMHVAELAGGARNLQSAMRDYRLFLLYRDGLLLATKEGGGSVKTIDDLRAAKTRFEGIQKTIAALEHPKGLEAHQKKQIAVYATPIATMTAALAAYDKGDTATYTQQVTKLVEDVKAISLLKTADELLGMHQYYDAMTARYNQLEKLIK